LYWKRLRIARNFTGGYNCEDKWNARLKSTKPNVAALMSLVIRKGNAVNAFAIIGSSVSSQVAYSLLK